jgi:hypothetical protein
MPRFFSFGIIGASGHRIDCWPAILDIRDADQPSFRWSPSMPSPGQNIRGIAFEAPPKAVFDRLRPFDTHWPESIQTVHGYPLCPKT